MYLASLATIQNNNWYTDVIFFRCQVKQILFGTIVKSSLSNNTSKNCVWYGRLQSYTATWLVFPAWLIRDIMLTSKIIRESRRKSKISNFLANVKSNTYSHKIVKLKIFYNRLKSQILTYGFMTPFQALDIL